jgi:ABC-type phosphate transport system permease subunit
MKKNRIVTQNDKLIKRKSTIDFTSRIIILAMASLAVISLLVMFTFILKTAIPAIAHYGFFQIYFTASFDPASGQFGI